MCLDLRLNTEDVLRIAASDLREYYCGQYVVALRTYCSGISPILTFQRFACI
ncbi:hypothetical protein APHCRT_0768 [Anaplasma phagocytophilum str. CRT53-1]|uniref:Uncharacterized protein n=1 Tax=Anaplasma phagocytophilum str. CRT53-1 TaxID=1359157 RepID=A0A0F3Q0M8_ANAPH|nr:hypothetical protein APHCRT_0768 [Anaplasma phagocytophilum str. CRT53-1]